MAGQVKRIYIGTSGYSYQDWKDNFYPPGLSPGGQLNYYSSIFNTVELNFTYYSFPNQYIFFNMCKKIKDNEEFLFSVKANKVFTHERKYNKEDAKKFLSSLKPLSDAGRLGSILFQFPYSFFYKMDNLDYIIKTAEHFKSCDISIEFRNNSWMNDIVIDRLKSEGIGFCNVDEPGLKGLLPFSSISTSNTGYLRFHGRNSKFWWHHEFPYQRYDYMYDQKELEACVHGFEEVVKNTEKSFVYFNNHYKGKSAKSALLFQDLLKTLDNYTSQN